MRRLLLLIVGACSFRHGELNGSGDPNDPAIDAPSGTATGDVPVDTQQCWSQPELGLNVCLASPLTGAITVASNTRLDTTSPGGSGLQCTVIGGVCVVAAQAITINSSRTLSAGGTRPLVLIASAIQINGTIDVASHIMPGQIGAGANMPGCNAGSDPSSNSGGGGQGGSFGTPGGDGGDQDGTNNSRGLAGVPIAATTLRGGCPGTRGGDSGGNAGDGGGALMLFATTITFGTNGAINASGAGARGANNDRRGGGGAGSGGMIALSATQITVGASSQIFANGGGGGGGSDIILNGGNGGDSTAASTGGTGGNGSGEAGNGGDGFSGTGDGEDGNKNSAGGGGGGGGAGVIRNFSPSSLGANVSPLPS